MSQIRRAVYYSFLQKGTTFVAQFAATIAIARILTPAEIGVFSVAAAIVGIAHVIRQFGISDYIIQEQALDQGKLRAAFTVSVMIGATLAAIFYFAAPHIADAYGAPDLALLLRALSANFILLPMGSIATAVLYRNLEFGALTIVQASSVVLSSILSVVLAFDGYSYFSLAFSSIAGNLLMILGLAAIRRKQFVMVPTLHGLGRVFRFSSYVTGGSLIDYAASRAPELVLPRTIGFDALGLFSRGYGLINSFYDVYGSTFLSVAKPVYARAASEQALLARTHLSYLEKTAIVPIYFGGIFAIFSEQIIFLLFGPKWSGAAPVLMWFGLSLIVGTPNHLAHVLLVSSGQAKTILGIAMLKAVLSCIALLVGQRIGLAATAALLASIPALTVPSYLHAVRKSTTLDSMQILRACWRGAWPTIPGLLVASLCHVLDPRDVTSTLATLTLGCGAAGVCTLLVARQFGHPLILELKTLWSGIQIKRKYLNRRP